MARPGRKSGAWTEQLEKLVGTLGHASEPSTTPLPTTRELAAEYGVANSTVFRQLARYESEGRLWRSPGGRFYDPRVQVQLDKPKPIACLFRRIENWSFLYQELMEGISAACEEQGRATLLWHDENLVRHTEIDSPPKFATAATQTRSLESFLDRYADAIDGLILDHGWSDKALAILPATLRQKSVLLCRPAPAGIHGVFPDMPGQAAAGLTRLLAAGCQEIHAVVPFAGDPAVDFALSAIHRAAASASYPLAADLAAGTTAERSRLLQKVRKSRRRVGLLSPEDNIAALLHAEQARPGEFEILSLQGTRMPSVVARLRTDYAALGRKAVVAAGNRRTS